MQTTTNPIKNQRFQYFQTWAINRATIQITRPRGFKPQNSYRAHHALANIALFQHEPSIGVTHSHPFQMYGIVATNDQTPMLKRFSDQANRQTKKII